ncbi:hypothetical protein O4H26_05940 [Aequorivita viscosa]|nr:hypothetical protein [Aequorivita viscosa]
MESSEIKQLNTQPQQYENRAIFAKAMLSKYFSLAPNIVVSDIGAGYGHMKNKVHNLGGTWQPFDYVRKIEESLDWNLENPAPGIAVRAGTVLFLEVLEHLSNPFLGLKNISNHISKNGFLIMTTPNPASSKNTINLLLKGKLYAFQEKHLIEHHVFTPWEHIVRFLF